MFSAFSSGRKCLVSFANHWLSPLSEPWCNTCNQQPKYTMSCTICNQRPGHRQPVIPLVMADVVTLVIGGLANCSQRSSHSVVLLLISSLTAVCTICNHQPSHTELVTATCNEWPNTLQLNSSLLALLI